MKNVEKNVLKNEVSKLLKETVKRNKEMFDEEELQIIYDNINLISKIYILGLLDSKN